MSQQEIPTAALCKKRDKWMGNSAKAVGNVPGTNLQAVSPAQWAEETCNTEQAGADNTSFTLLLALGSEKPNDELNVFSP